MLGNGVCVEELGEFRRAMWDNKRMYGMSMCDLWKSCELTLNPVEAALLPTMRVTMPLSQDKLRA